MQILVLHTGMCNSTVKYTDLTEAQGGDLKFIWYLNVQINADFTSALFSFTEVQMIDWFSSNSCLQAASEPTFSKSLSAT